MTNGALLVGQDIKTRTPVAWLPGPHASNPNPHLQIVGESGYGKTYAIQCLISELAGSGHSSVVFDYAQGFTSGALDPLFVRDVRPREVLASTKGININPLRIATSDSNGPVNVAVRVSDTFARIYRIGIQQHALLRDTILEAYAALGISRDRPRSWTLRPPNLVDIYRSIEVKSEDNTDTSYRLAQSLRSHLSSFFIFDTFRRSGQDIAWSSLYEGQPQCYILQLHGLEDKIEKAVTEFLLWDLYNFLRATGVQSLRLFCVLDEAHKLSFAENAPVDKLLREGRKFGVGLIMASQQPEDFSSVAQANTASKLLFHTADRRNLLTKALAQSYPELGRYDQIARVLGTLRRGRALFAHAGKAQIVDITPLDQRASLRRRLAPLL